MLEWSYLGDARGFPGQNWRQGYQSEAEKPIAYLTALGQGNCFVEHNSCTLLSCDGGTDNYLPLQRCKLFPPLYAFPVSDQGHSNMFILESNRYRPWCNYLATYAQDIVNTCHQHPPLWPTKDWRVYGQEFDSDRYNVFVKWGC